MTTPDGTTATNEAPAKKAPAKDPWDLPDVSGLVVGVLGGTGERDPAGLVHDDQAIALVEGAAGLERCQQAGADREWRRARQVHRFRLTGART
jgi:hypothetical protein